MDANRFDMRATGVWEPKNYVSQEVIYVPRLEFDSVDEFKRWIKDMTAVGRHVAYVSDTEVAIMPLRSTRPIVAAWCEVGKEELPGVLEALEEKGIGVYKGVRVVWKLESGVPF